MPACRRCGKKAPQHIPEVDGFGACWSCGKQVESRKKDLDEILIDGIVIGTGGFVLFAALLGLWRHPESLLLLWACGVGYAGGRELWLRSTR